ncbi:MAG: hypothetical protein KatS3mg057_0166 [Herpetosiphonaceae bacterium]|nr:MAG: hypothetical protein KatS3mg057_0166 [Herpetosiphonaceae bacterium]
MFDVMRFWLDLGVDGFRLDAIGAIFEHPELPNHEATLSLLDVYRAQRAARTPEDWRQVAQMWRSLFYYQVDQPGIHHLMQELRAVVDEYDDRVLVGETDDISYYGAGDDELHLVFNFPLMQMERLTPAWIRANQDLRLSALPSGAWPCNTLGNHDSPRCCSRYSDGRDDKAVACTALALMLTLRGTPFLYYGEEIGMCDLMLDDVEQFRDMLGTWLYRIETGALGTPHQEALRFAVMFGRDKCRTPMQWSAAPNAGFCPADVSPWLPVHPNYAQGLNVACQIEDPASLLNFYRRMLRLRRETPALIAGDYTPLHPHAEEYLAFLRSDAGSGQRCLVVLNMSDRPHTLHVDLGAGRLRPLFSSHSRTMTFDDPACLSLAPNEIYIAEFVQEGA